MRRRITIIAAALALLQFAGATTLSCRHHWARVRHRVEPDDWSRCEAPCLVIDCTVQPCPAILDTPGRTP